MNLEQWEVFTYHRSKISSTVLVQYCIVAHKPCLNLLNRIEYIFINWSRLSTYSLLACHKDWFEISKDYFFGWFGSSVNYRN